MTTRQLQVGIAVVVALAVIALFFAFSNPFTMQPASSLTPPSGSTSSLVAQDEVVGTGATAQAGDTLSVNYTGKLQDGTVFDTSVGRAPFQFTLGAGEVIPGWDQGIAGMKVGGKRLLIIPPSLGYGASGYGPIPANATLVFEVELLSVKPAGTVAPIPEGPSTN